jgi:hypothetical protein
MNFLHKLFGKRESAVPSRSAALEQRPTGTESAEIDRQFLQAATEGNAHELRTLVQKGANIDAKDKEQGWTPLMRAIEGGHTKAAKFLIESKANVNVKADTGTTALMVAAIKGNLQVIRLLLKAGADAAAKEMHGKTALDLANQKLKALGQQADKEFIGVREVLSKIQTSVPRTRLNRTDDEEHEYQRLLIDREIELMNTQNIPGGFPGAAGRLANIEKRLRELGWKGRERTSHA